jgi:hypothetical protein
MALTFLMVYLAGAVAWVVLFALRRSEFTAYQTCHRSDLKCSAAVPAAVVGASRLHSREQEALGVSTVRTNARSSGPVR